jgi:hypothetical protein
MRARCPGPVGGDNPVSPVELLTRESPFGTVCLATTVAGVMRTRGHPRLDSKRECDCRWYDERVMGQAGFVGAMLVHLNGITRSVLHSAGKVRNLCRVSNLFK